MMAAGLSDSGYTQWDVVLLTTYILLALVFSFLCSVAEAVLLSITPSYIAGLQDKNSKLAALLKQLKQDNVDQSLAAILTLNTIAHTVGAIGVGDQASKIWVDANPLITGLLIPVVMTLAILILSELIPKTLGANYWKELTPFTARSLVLIIRLLAPLVWFSQFVTKALKKGDTVSLVGFGTFSVRKRAARTGRNPRTGETIKIKASKNPAFKAGKALKDAVN